MRESQLKSFIFLLDNQVTPNQQEKKQRRLD